MNHDSNENSKSEIDNGVMGHLVSANAAFPESARQQMSLIMDEVLKNNDYLNKIISTHQNTAVKAGFAAEEIHRFTYNAEAILQDKAARAYTASCKEWKLPVNDPMVDLVVEQDGKIISTNQMKYFRTAQDTEAALRVLDQNGNPKYAGCDKYVGPADQIEKIKELAHRTKLKNMETRPQVSAAAEKVETNVTDRVNELSRPTTKKEAERLVRNTSSEEESAKNIQSGYQNRSTVQQMQHAAAYAAGITAVIVGTVNTMQYLSLVRQGKISTGEAIRGIVKNTAVASVDSAIKAAAATGAVSLATRCSVGTLANQAVNSMTGTAGIAGGAICAVDMIQCMVLVAAGKMSMADMETRTGKNIFQTSAAIWGSSVGMGITTSLGAATTGLAAICSGMAGGLIAGMAVSIAIENHIEKPYQEITANTSALTAVAEIAQEVSDTFVEGQKAFTAFLLIDRMLEQQTSDQLARIDHAGDLMNKAISRI